MEKIIQIQTDLTPEETNEQGVVIKYSVMITALTNYGRVLQKTYAGNWNEVETKSFKKKA